MGARGGAAGELAREVERDQDLRPIVAQLRAQRGRARRRLRRSAFILFVYGCLNLFCAWHTAEPAKPEILPAGVVLLCTTETLDGAKSKASDDAAIRRMPNTSGMPLRTYLFG